MFNSNVEQQITLKRLVKTFRASIRMKHNLEISGLTILRFENGEEVYETGFGDFVLDSDIGWDSCNCFCRSRTRLQICKIRVI
jgi:hypothetical protein